MIQGQPTQPFASPEEALAHFGVKGMRWGVRKDTTVTVGGKTKKVSAKKAAKLDASWEKNVFTLPEGIKRHNAMADHVNANIGKLNNSPRFKNADLNKDKKTEVAYYKAFNKLQEDAFNKAVKEVHGSSPTGKREAVVKTQGDKLQIVIRDASKVRHAAEDDSFKEVFLFTITRNERGFITKVEPVTNELAQIDDDSHILEHYGVKGMRWGVRNENDEGGDRGGKASAKKNAEQKGTSPKAAAPPMKQKDILDIAVGKPIGYGIPGASSPRAQTGDSGDKRGLSSNQKKALIGLGVVAAAGAGYYAYSHYKGELFMPGGMKPPDWDVSGLKHGPLSKTPLGGFSKKYPSMELLNMEKLTLDTSRGFAEYRPKGGFPSEFAAGRHKDMIDAFEEMRKQYPSVRNMNVEFVPFSHAPGGVEMHLEGALAAVMPMGKGEARIMYNDMIKSWDEIAPTAAARRATEAFVPGMFKDKYVAYHEMGHVLAVANGDMAPIHKMLDGTATAKHNALYGPARHYYHKQTFKKHGFSFKELSKLGQYAGTQPAESMAELYGHYHHPEMRKRLTPDQLARAKKMFDDMGGVP